MAPTGPAGPGYGNEFGGNVMGSQEPESARCSLCQDVATIELGAWLPDGSEVVRLSCERHEHAITWGLAQMLDAS